MSEPNQFQVDDHDEGERLDVYLASRFPDRSRVSIRKAITAGTVTVGGSRAKPAYRLKAGQLISVELPDLPAEGPTPENIPLDVLFEDDAIAVINKPPGMVVHPAKGHWEGTLTSALAWRFQEASGAGGPTRPGIVHRLDRDTSGVIVVARTDAAHLRLAAQFEARTVEKQYLAITTPAPDRDRDRIEKPIGPHPYHREKMAIREHHKQSRTANTFYETAERFRGFALVKVTPRTGRTHQIRVHLASIGAPVLCDKLYGGRSLITLGEVEESDNVTVLLERQALHAQRLSLEHPLTNEPLTFEAPLPADISNTLEAIRKHRM